MVVGNAGAEKHCKHCDFARPSMKKGSFVLLGCYHHPYEGRWVVNIKECPMEKSLEKTLEAFNLK